MSPRTPQDELRAAIDRALEGVAMPEERFSGYRPAVVHASTVALLLIVGYLGITVGLGWSAWVVGRYVLTEVVAAFDTAHLRDMAMRGFPHLLFTMPAVAALASMTVVLVVALVRPLFGDATTLTLAPGDAPLLHRLAEGLGDKLGLRAAMELQLSHNWSASAAYHKGLWGRLRGKAEMDVGVAVTRRLSVASMAGLVGNMLARVGLGASATVDAVLATMGAVLARHRYYAATFHPRKLLWSLLMGPLCHIPGVAIILVQLLRHVVGLLGRVVDGARAQLHRHHQAAADIVEVAMVGTGAYASTLAELHLLRVSFDLTTSYLGEVWDEGALPEDLPEVVTKVAALLDDPDSPLPEATHAAFAQSRAMSDAVIATQVEALAQVGHATPVFATGGVSALYDSASLDLAAVPAEELFDDLDELSRRLTRALYADAFGEDARDLTMVPTDDFVARLEAWLAPPAATEEERPEEGTAEETTSEGTAE